MYTEFLHKKKLLAAAIAMPLVLAACNGDDGKDGEDAVNTLVTHTLVAAGNEQCYQGGLQISSGTDEDGDAALDSEEVQDTSYLCAPTQLNADKHFNRVATFAVCSQIDENCDTDTETVAEIVAASTDGMTLIYTDSPGEQVGFVDIADPSKPAAAGTVALDGEPTSVAVNGDYALVAVNTSTDYVNVSGQLDVINIATHTRVRSIDLGGQPDSIAVSKDGAYAAIAIENERDEDAGDGRPSQLPAGGFVIVDMAGAPAAWTTRSVDMTGIADLYGDDPEPEYVDINSDNVAVVTLQENNHIILVDLASGEITNHFSAGAVDLIQVDLQDERPNQINQTESAAGVLREPDGVSWVNSDYFATANEGDMDGGSRGFSIFNTDGEVVWDSGAELDHLTARLGHYPDKRSDAKGNEPENAEVGVFGNERYLFINSERSSLVFVYNVADPQKPVFKQALPAAAGPEGVLAIPSRNLLIAASEEDSRDDKLRGALNIYSYQYAEPQYPTLKSADRENGTPIPWAAMSGLAADPEDNHTLYAVEDSFFAGNRIFTINTATTPATLTKELRIVDSNDVFAALTVEELADNSVDDDDATRINVFDEADLAAMINADKTINIDPEGIAKASDGGFWVASEGAGTVGESNRPINSANLIFKTDENGVIEEVITLPASWNAMQVRFGFEGVAEYDGKLYVAVQRAWGEESNPRIGIYDLDAETWSYVYYPLDSVESQNGGWVGLSDITPYQGGFLVVERDNQFGPDAAIKRIYMIFPDSYAEGNTTSKYLMLDLLPDLQNYNGLTPEKIEGLTVTPDGDVYIINDNDGVDDNSGETLLMKVDLDDMDF